MASNGGVAGTIGDAMEGFKTMGEELDASDPLAKFREHFVFPTVRSISAPPNKQMVKGTDNGDSNGHGSDDECTYLCGNSLGLQPKTTERAVIKDLQGWKSLGVEGHFTQPYNWVDIEDTTTAMGARVVGAKESEVVHMNSLTVNLHLMMVAFYRPEKGEYITGAEITTDHFDNGIVRGVSAHSNGNHHYPSPKRLRNKILMERKAFPSDDYAIQSQVIHHGLSPDDAIIKLEPKEGKYCLDTDDIVQILEEQGEEIALVLLSGIQYYTGQLFDIPKITHKAKQMGCTVGWDLAHAAGNVMLHLHEWKVDFAVWCTYKYLNSGPGGLAGCFVHEDHHHSPDDQRYINRFAGWWGHDRKSRFVMDEVFVPQKGAYGFQLSNPPTLPMRQLAEALKIHDAAGMTAIRQKSERLTMYLEQMIRSVLDKEVEIITPSKPSARGAQLSIIFTRMPSPLKFVHDYIRHHEHIVVDFREPNVIRVAAAPLYNKFTELYKFVLCVRRALDVYIANLEQ